jgi:hypothetical protein
MEKRNAPGRPPLDDDGGPSAQLSVRLPPREFDRLYQRAQRARVTVPELLRRDIRRLNDTDAD